MKRLILLTSVAVLALAQTTIPRGQVNISADRQQTNGQVRHLTGHVLIETSTLILHADEVDFNPDTLDITPRGEVHLKLK